MLRNYTFATHKQAALSAYITVQAVTVGKSLNWLLLLPVRTSGNGDTGADECQPVPSAREPVTYRASQAALRASM